MDAGQSAAAGEQVYRLRVVLAGISPLIWRQLDVAASTTLAGLHLIGPPVVSSEDPTLS